MEVTMERNYAQLGFGFLRLPHIDPNDECDVDFEAVKAMVDLYLSRGFDYFDTAYIYHKSQNEGFLKKALVDRYPRDCYRIATKLPCGPLRKGKTAEGIFAEQLESCGVDYFDVYLLHGLNAKAIKIAEEYHCFEFLKKLKEEGKAKRIGFSFHDSAKVLDELLTRHPEVDVVQIQLNYLDWDNEIIESGACYEVCRKHGKSILVMEPVKGGTLAKLPEEAERLLAGEKPAHRAIRFAASQEGVEVVLSGMSTLEQVDENTSFMKDFQPLTEEEIKVLNQVKEIVKSAVAVPCTGCSYCTEGCPAGIPIPQYFSLYNEHKLYRWQVLADVRYNKLTERFPRANTCLECGQCEEKCPQKLPIIQHLKAVAEEFDNEKKA